jgi:uncharacterized membrane protein
LVLIRIIGMVIGGIAILLGVLLTVGGAFWWSGGGDSFYLGPGGWLTGEELVSLGKTVVFFGVVAIVSGVALWYFAVPKKPKN